MTKKMEEVATVKHEVAASPMIGRGFENVDMEEINIPRAKLLQSNSPELADRDYNFRAGDVMHTLMMAKVPERFVPLSIFTSNVMFVPREEGKKVALKTLLNLTDDEMKGMIICKAADGKYGTKYGNCAVCGKQKFHGNEKPLCNETINILAAPLEDDGSVGLPYVIQFANTSFKHGKKFRDMAFYSSLGGDLFGRVYKLESKEAAGGGNRWFEMMVKPAGVVPTEMLGQFENMYRNFAGKVIVVDDTPEEEAEVNY